MKFAWYLLVIVMTTVNLSQEKEDYLTCNRNCNAKRGGKYEDLVNICGEDGSGYQDRCAFDCAAKYDIKYRDKELKEAECKPWSYEYCFNNNCTERERKNIRVWGEVTEEIKNKLMCLKEPPHLYSDWPCSQKCYSKVTWDIDLEFVPCNETNVEKMLPYG